MNLFEQALIDLDNIHPAQHCMYIYVYVVLTDSEMIQELQKSRRTVICGTERLQMLIFIEI